MRMDRIGKVATTVGRDADGTVRVTYHSTDVVRVNGRTITLNTGGYRTYTTKARMNQAAHQLNLGFTVYQSAGDWFVKIGGRALKFENESITFEIG